MNIEDIIKEENKVYCKPELLEEVHMHYCPGCSHGVIHKLLAEVIAEMGLTEKTVGVSPVGCAVFAYNYIDVDWIEAAHGRPPYRASGPRTWCSHTRATATCRPSVPLNQSTPPTAERTS